MTSGLYMLWCLLCGGSYECLRPRRRSGVRSVGTGLMSRLVATGSSHTNELYVHDMASLCLRDSREPMSWFWRYRGSIKPWLRVAVAKLFKTETAEERRDTVWFSRTLWDIVRKIVGKD